MKNKKVGIGIAVSVGVILMIAAVFVVDALLEAGVDAQYHEVFKNNCRKLK